MRKGNTLAHKKYTHSVVYGWLTGNNNFDVSSRLITYNFKSTVCLKLQW